MFTGPPNPHRVAYDHPLDLSTTSTRPPDKAPKKKEAAALLEQQVDRLAELQGRLYASDRASLLVVFQAMDAAGKDGTISAVLSGVNPAGCQVYAFKVPSEQELDHDFLWRHLQCAPERGRMGIWNRSWYEEVLVVRVHPEFLDRQRLPWSPRKKDLWEERFDSIRDVEQHLARNGTAILKFFLHVSKEEQRERLLARVDDPKKNWKVEPRDVQERERWDDYQHAYAEALAATSRPWAPWYAIPADDKPYMRLQVATIMAEALASLPLEPPQDSTTSERLSETRRLLAGEDAGSAGGSRAKRGGRR